jgi:tetratricopeptide (TPR) repeat protein
VQEEYYLTNFSNFQNAVNWAAEERQTELHIQLISVLLDYWEALGYFKEGLDVVSRFLRSSADIDPRTRAYLLDSASTLAWHQHDFDVALAYAKEAVELSGGEKEDPMYRNLLGRIYIEQGNFLEARAVLEECLALIHENTDGLNPGPPLAQLGEVALFEGRIDEAKTLLERSLSHLNNDDVIFLTMAKTDLAECALAKADYEQARYWLAEAFPTASIHVRRSLVFLCASAGYLVLSSTDMEDAKKAARFYGAIGKLSMQAGVGFNSFYQNLNRERMRIARGKLSDEEWLEAFESGRGWERGEAIQQAKELVAHNRR